MRTGDGREINRHNFSREEIRVAKRRSVVQRLERLIRLRNSHAAFDGSFRVEVAADDRLRMSWAGGADTCALDVDFRSMRSHVELTDPSGSHQEVDC